jgi:hypothetical protein
LDDLHPGVVDHRRDLVVLNMCAQCADDRLKLLDDLKFVLLDRDDQLSRDLMLCDRLTGDQKMGDRYSIPHDLMQLRHVIRQNVPMKDVKKVDLNLDGQKMDDLMMNAPRIRRVKMKVGMNYYGHY